ncbi:MAG: LacI family DNA-binding transcriptional regulator [Trueperaceae bacterium]
MPIPTDPPSDRRTRQTRRGHGRATLADVARQAGVSAITVSRTLREPERVATATRDRVERAVEEVGYIPNLVAGSLASSAPRIAAAILPSLDDSIFTEVLKGTVDVLEDAGYQLILGNSHFDPDTEAELVATFLAHRVGAISLTGAFHTARTRSLLARAGVPVVETWSLPRRPLGACVGLSNEAAAFAMTDHLARRGYRRIAFVSAPVTNNDRAAARRRGYSRALRQHGLAYDRRIVLESSLGLVAGGRALDRIRCARADTDAIFFANDVLAVGAVLHALRTEIRVPEDVAIAGFDDTELAGQLVPPLTTVRVDRIAIGTAAGDLMLRALRGEAIVGRRVDVGFEVVVRATT